VSGLTKDKAVSTISSLIDLENIQLTVKPWWSKTLPQSADQVHITVEE